MKPSDKSTTDAPREEVQKECRFEHIETGSSATIIFGSRIMARNRGPGGSESVQPPHLAEALHLRPAEDHGGTNILLEDGVWFIDE